MSEISETEIKAMTKEQNYMRGYKDGKSDVLGKIRAEIDDLEVYYDNDYFCGNKDAMYKRNEVLQIIDKYQAEARLGHESI